MSRHDLRREERQNCSQPVAIMWRDASGDDKFMNAPVRDISESGLGVEILEPVPVRSLVTLRANKLGIHGSASVRHCAREGLQYRIGVEFTGGFRWRPAEEEAALSK
jgi:PilZ domain